ncbi:MAG: translocation/assembly module TamB domain-containing protein [bacterium]
MSLRLWLLCVFFALLLLITFTVLIWPFLHVDNFIKDLLVEQTDAFFSGTIELQRATPGLSSLNLVGLHVQDSLGFWSFRADNIRISFSLIKFVRRRFNFLESITSVTFSNPELTYRISPTEETSEEAAPKPEFSFWDSISKIPDALWLESVTLRGGKINILSEQRTPLLKLSSLVGGLEATMPGRAKGELRGNLNFGANTEITAEMTLDRNLRSFEATLQNTGNNFFFDQSSGLPDSLTLRLAHSDLQFRYWSQPPRDGFEGELLLKDLQFGTRKGELFRCDTLRVLLGDWKLAIPPFTVEGLGADWELSGGVSDLRNPMWDIDVRALFADGSKLSSWLPTSFPIQPSGKANLQAHIEGALSAPTANVQWQCEQLETEVDQFQNVRLAGTISKDRIEVKSLTASCASGPLRLNAYADHWQHLSQLDSRFLWQGALPGLADGYAGTLDGHVRGLDGQILIQGSWLRADDVGLPIDVEAVYSLTDDAFSATTKISGTNAQLDLDVQNLTKKPIYRLQFADPLLLAQQFYRWDGWIYTEGLHLEGDLSGSQRQLDGHFQLFHQDRPYVFLFDGLLTMEDIKTALFEGTMSLQSSVGTSVEGYIAWNLRNNIFTLESLNLDEAIEGYGSVDFTNGEFGVTELRISNWSVSRLLQHLTPELTDQVDGVLDGRMEVYGTLQDPIVAVNLYASRGYYQQWTDLWAVISAQLEDQVWSLKECNLGRGVLGLLRANGVGAMDGSSFDVRLFSDRADISDFLDMFGMNPLKIAGPLNFNTHLYGSIKQPKVDLTVNIAPGMLYKIPFEYLTVSAHLDTSTNQAIFIESLKLFQSSDLFLEGQGYIPIKNTPLELKFALRGNILKIPSMLDRSIITSNGQGELVVELNREQDQLRLNNARLQISNGTMKFSSVVSEIRSLEAMIELQENRLVIQKLGAIVEGQPFRISNTFDERMSNAEHLYFASLDLDLGIISIETEGRGLHVDIPALMHKKTRSYLRLLGKSAEEKFTISGPIQNPQIHGQVRISGGMFSYPFPPTTRPPAPFVKGVLEVLQSMRWDLTVIPERDNRYVRQIRGLEGSPFLREMSDLFTTVDVNLMINPGSSQLQVLGSMDTGDFRLQGQLESTQGTIEYLDLKFRVDRFLVEFDKHSPLPWVQGRGKTAYIDSLGQSRNIYLTLYVMEPTTREKTLRGRWGDFVFILEGDLGSSQEQILATLGYSPQQISDKVSSLGGAIVSNVFVRHWIRPIERELENVLNVDVIRIQPTFAQHLFETEILGVDPGPNKELSWGAYFLRQSQLTVGKYISDDLFVTYTGQWETGINETNERHFGFLHNWTLEYRIQPISNNLVLTLGYEYDSLEQLEDKKVLLRYSFTF